MEIQVGEADKKIIQVSLAEMEIATLVALLGWAHELPWQTAEEYNEITQLYRKFYDLTDNRLRIIIQKQSAGDSNGL